MADSTTPDATTREVVAKIIGSHRWGTTKNEATADLVLALLSELGYAWHDAGVSEYLHLVAHLETALGEEGEHAAAVERDELQQLFDLQQIRMWAAVELWRQEDPDARALLAPDLGALLDWLMQRPVVYDQAQGHIYRSTACLHAHEPGRDHLHRECQTDGKRWDGTAKTPAECKVCAAPCQCGCHTAVSLTDLAVEKLSDPTFREAHRQAVAAVAGEETSTDDD